MRTVDKFRLRLRSLFRRRRVEHELEHELRFHLDQLIEENIAAGMGPGGARRAALRALGGVSQLEEECRDMRRVNFMDDFLRDLKYAGRSLRRNPGFAVLAVLTMALGIGANTAVFSVVNAVLLKPLALNEPDRIVAVTGVPTDGDPADPLSRQVSIVNVWDWHDQAKSFDAMAFYASRETSVNTGDNAEYVRAARVSRDFYDVFAVKPVIGRIYTAEEE
jgi:macrolide transport system ATP-binding/permease protein